MVRRLLLLFGALLVLAACRLDVTVDLVIGPDGTGALTVVAAADAEVVAQAPGLADDLRFEDAIAAGWVVEGPTPTEAGGLTVTLRHAVTSTDEASNLLGSLGPPFVGMQLTRTTDGDATTTELAGQLALPSGFAAFADSDLLAAVGGTPFAARLAASGATPATSMAVQLRVTLPGEIETTGERAAGAIVWDAPLDGGAVDVAAQAEQRAAPGWASILSTAALVLLVAWIVVVVIAVVVILRRRGRRGPPSLRRLNELHSGRT